MDPEMVSGVMTRLLKFGFWPWTLHYPFRDRSRTTDAAYSDLRSERKQFSHILLG